METIDFIIKISALIGAILAIGAFLYGIVRWFQKQDQQTTDIADLKEMHEKDVEKLGKKEADDLQGVKDELCVLSYAVLATLDGLKQLGANGNVTKAHNELEKHLNQQAHGQKRGR